MKIKNKKNYKKYILIFLAVVLIAAGSAFFIIKNNNKQSTPSTEKYEGPTSQDKKDAADNKKHVSNREELDKQEDSSSDKKQVTPVITNAMQSGQQITINAYVSGVFEDGGKCSATISKGSNSITRTTNAFADATTTSCQPIFIDRSVFSEAGDWKVTMHYKSNSAEGSSQAVTLAVQ